MSEKIDVLAVMDSVIQRSGHVVACDVVEARAAVADLIHAARRASNAIGLRLSAEMLREAGEALDAALHRVAANT